MKSFFEYAQRTSTTHKALRSAAAITTAGIVLTVAHAVKISYIVGSWSSFFSATSIIVPAAGLVGGVYGSLGIALLRVIQLMVITPWRVSSLLLNVIPGFGASIYWSAPRSIVNFLLPATCIALFIAHPVGNQALWYSALWIVPIFVGLFEKKAPIFFHALSSTLVAHALGSVLWIYLLPTTPGLWLGMIPVVIVERLVMAAGIVFVGYLFAASGKVYKKVFSTDNSGCSK